MTEFTDRILKGMKERKLLEPKVREIFDVDYVPDDLRYRDEQCICIANNITNGNHTIAIGVVSTGKTVSVKKIFNTLKRTYISYCFVYQNCKESTISNMYYHIAIQMGGTPKASGWSLSRYIDMIESLSKNFEKVVICLDEVDCLIEKNDPKNLFYRFVDSSKFIVVFVTNNTNWYYRLDNRVQSRMSIKELNIVRFSTYNASEIYNILMDRATKGLKKMVLTTDEVALIAKIADQRVDKLRIAIRALSDIIDHKLKNNNNNHELSTAEILSFMTAINDKEKQMVTERFPYKMRLLLNIISQMSIEKIPLTINNITENWNSYIKLHKDESKRKNNYPQSPQSIRLFMEELEMYGHIEKQQGTSTGGRKPVLYVPLFDFVKYKTIYDRTIIDESLVSEDEKKKKAMDEIRKMGGS